MDGWIAEKREMKEKERARARVICHADGMKRNAPWRSCNGDDCRAPSYSNLLSLGPYPDFKLSVFCLFVCMRVWMFPSLFMLTVIVIIVYLFSFVLMGLVSHIASSNSFEAAYG